MAASLRQARLFDGFPDQVLAYPQLRFMGSKFRLLPWIYEVLAPMDFDTALDPFCGSGCVAYLLKSMGKQVTAADFLNFCATIATATVANRGTRVGSDELKALLAYDATSRRFIQRTFQDIFFTPSDLAFLDRASWNIGKLSDPFKQAVARAALIRSCAKRQPRGVFTVPGDPEHYKDGRRDLRLTLREHFVEQVEVYNATAFDNGRTNRAFRSNVFDLEPSDYDLVYLDPPYVPRSDDNCYIKRYHFLEGLSCYWQDVEILQTSRVKKLRKPYTPFSYRRSAFEAFDRVFGMFERSILVLSYSSNGFPNLEILVRLMKRFKSKVSVHRRPHRYHFGTHDAARRNEVTEYLIVGR